MHFLNEEQKNLIKEQIKNIESKSSAELVALFANKSSSYRYICLLLGVSFIFLLSVFLLIFEFKAQEIVQMQILSFIFFILFFDRFLEIIIKILPKSYKHKIAYQNSQRQFASLCMDKTLTKTAVMFFVSYKEKYAQIICDEAINEKIPNAYWHEILKVFTEEVKKDQLSQAYINAINSCSKILIENFPIKSDDKNELPDHVVELNL